MNLFAPLKNNRKAIIQAETAALLHDLDKLEPDFLKNPAYHSRPDELEKSGRSVREIRRERWQRLVGKDQEITLAGLDLEALRYSAAEENKGQDYYIPDRKTFGSLAAPFIDHHENSATTYSLLAWLVHGGGSGSDGIDSDMDKASRSKNDKDSNEKDPMAQLGDAFVIDTPFGYRQEEWQDVLGEVQTILNQADFSNINRQKLFSDLKPCFRRALGETRYPCNDVTLWAHAFSTASIGKALLAKTLIEFSQGEFSPEKPYRVPQRTTKRSFNPGDFTLVRITFDREYLLGRGQKAGDIAGMAAQIESLQDSLVLFMEEELLVGNQTYRDETRQLFLLPRLNTWFEDNREVFPGLHEQFEKELSLLLTEKIEALLFDNHCENLPFAIDFSQSGEKLEGEAGKRIIERSRALLQSEAVCRQSVRALLKGTGGGSSVVTSTHGRCEICGIRQISADKQSARGLKLCAPCLERRRDERSQRRRNRRDEHLTSDLGRLIDTDSGENKLVMFSASFALDRLYDGTLIKAVRKGEKGNQNPSPARLYRAYETLEDFFVRFRREVVKICQPGLFPITLSPRRLEFIISAKYADQVISRLQELYEEEFARVRGRLPLSLGAIFFYNKFPLYVVLAASSRLRPLLTGRKTEFEISDRSTGNNFHQLELLSCGREPATSADLWLLPAKLSNGLNEDICYSCFDTSAGDQVLNRDINTLNIDDRLLGDEGSFTFLLLDSAARRYAIKKEAIRHHLGGLRKPYRLAEWKVFGRVWELMKRLNHSQISQFENALIGKQRLWGRHWRADDPAVLRFCELLLFAPNAFGKKGSDGRYIFLDNASNLDPAPEHCDRKLLVRAAVSGLLLDVIDFYIHLQNKEI